MQYVECEELSKEARMGLKRVGSLVVLSLVAAMAIAIPVRASLTAEALPAVSLADALELAGVALPTDGSGLILHADFPAGSPYNVGGASYTALTLDLTPDGVKTLSAVPASAASAAPGTEVEECTDPAFASVGKRWNEEDLPIDFAINHRTVPNYMSPWLTTRSIREAHQVWGLTNSKCESKDSIDFRFNYVGSSRARVKYDQVSIAEFGRLGRAVAMSYVWYSGTRIREVDLRLNKSYRWTNRAGVSKRYNVKNVAVHEIGHALGLDDLGQPHGSLTMFGVIGKGELRKTTLGKGDVKGAQLAQP